jgi:hypothetical protein
MQTTAVFYILERHLGVAQVLFSGLLDDACSNQLLVVPSRTEISNWNDMQ